MILILSSLLAWGFLAWYSYKHPITLSRSDRGGGGGGSSTTSHTYYYYKIKLPHNCIDPSQSIIFYDAYGALLYTLPPYYENMDYGTGVITVPGSEKNETVEQVSTATYYVYYSSDDLIIDFDNAEFKIAKKIVRVPAETLVNGTFEYEIVSTPLRDVASVIDGRWDTQIQSVFYGEPPQGYHYATLDLGQSYEIQAIDILAGFYKPDDYRKFDVDFTVSLEYSTDGSNFYAISDEASNIELKGGESFSLEEDELGIGFTARYLRLILQKVKKVEFDKGRWIVALTEVSAYANIVIKSEATLIATTALTVDVNQGDTTVYVESTSGFDSPESAETETAYIGSDSFTYTGLTGTSFTGCTVGSGITGSIGDRVSQTVESDTTLYDDEGLRAKLGDRLMKKNVIDKEVVYSQSQLDYLSKRYLREYYKDHSKISVEVLYSPHLQVGQTIAVVDSYNGINSNYFIESIKDNNGYFSLVLAKYPN